MQLYCKRVGESLTVVAVHADGDALPPSAYGADVVVLAYAGPVPIQDLIGHPVPDLDLRAYAAAKRYAVETGGVTVSGMLVATDLKSQARITGADAYMAAAQVGTLQFKAVSGRIELSAEQVRAVALAVGAHVQACFAAEGAADAAITAGTITSLADVDAVFAALL